MNIKHIKILITTVILLLLSCNGTEESGNRNISEYKLNEICRFEYEDGYIIRTTVDDTLIYITSALTNSIEIYDYTGKHFKTIGKKGEAPWENGTIWSFYLDSNSYWLHDYPKMALKKYDSKTDTLQVFRRFITKHNVLYVHNNQFLVPNFDSGSGIFYLSFYDAIADSITRNVDINKLTRRFEKIPPYGDFTFQGNFCKNKFNDAVFYCTYNSAFFYYKDKTGEVTFHNDIRNLPIGEPTNINDVIHLSPMNVGIVSAAMDEKYIYMLTPRYLEENLKIKSYLIDVYKIDDKKYIKSFILPEIKHDYALCISVSTKGLIITGAYGNLIVYSLDFLNELQ